MVSIMANSQAVIPEGTRKMYGLVTIGSAPRDDCGADCNPVCLKTNDDHSLTTSTISEHINTLLGISSIHPQQIDRPAQVPTQTCRRQLCSTILHPTDQTPCARPTGLSTSPQSGRLPQSARIRARRTLVLSP